VEKLAVLARADLVNHVWLEIDVKRTRYVFPRLRLGKESAKAVSAISSHGVVASKAAVRLGSEVSGMQEEAHSVAMMTTHTQPVFDSVQFP